MKFELDIHTHTISSGHAYSTLEENVKAAQEKGLKLIVMTDHAPAMPGGAHLFYFYNMRILPEYINGVRIVKGAEANIIDYKGNIDLDEDVLSNLELVIASLHPPCLEFGTEKEHTETIIRAMSNPGINVIGHPGDIRYDFNIKEVVAASKETGTLLEINNSSLKPTSFRPGGDSMIRKIIEECKLQNVHLIMGSDAHFSGDVGNFEEASELLQTLKFPENKLLNNSIESFKDWFKIP
ncbi:MAG: phosphatase [Spirochaetaceae bacterium]|jgi:putative hydrolase|nr:phosphatase [Spirochaetaceae bacterium]